MRSSKPIQSRQLVLALSFTLLLLTDIALAIFVLAKMITNTDKLKSQSKITLTNGPNKNVLILYFSSQINEGAPRLGEICRFPTVPILNIWGDGLTYIVLWPL